MKSKKTTKFIGSLLAVVSIMAVNPITANAEWKTDNSGKWYSKGSSWAVGWQPIDGDFYYFNNNGYMVSNTIIDGMQLGNDGKCKMTNKVSSNGEDIKPYKISIGSEYNSNNKKFKMSGNEYSNGFTIGDKNYALFNLENKYEEIKVTVGYVDSILDGYMTVTVYLDDKESQSFDVSSEDIAKEIKIAANKAGKMKIVISDRHNTKGIGTVYCGFANMIGY